MTTKPTKFVFPEFLKGKTGEEFADDAARIHHDKPDSGSARAVAYVDTTLWNEKVAQGEVNASNARSPRKEVTQAEILAVKDDYIDKRGFARGWINYAMLTFDVSRNTIASRLRKKK